MASRILAPSMQLPWSSSSQEDTKFKKVFTTLLVPFLILCVVIPLVNLPEEKREDLEKLPPQLARVVIDEKVIPKPPPTPAPTPEPKKEEPKKEEPKKPEPKKEEPKKEEPKKPEPKKEEPKPAKLVEKAREAAQAEINQFSDALADMRDSFDLSDTNQALTQSTGEAAQIDRNIIGRSAKTGSGGIKTSDLSRNTGGVALSGKETTKVDSQLADTAGVSAKPKKAAGRNKAFRSDEDIRKVMDRNKGSISAVYYKELRKNPSLEGKVVFKLVIGPNGRVTSASIVSSDLNDPKLERRLLAKIRSINFGASEVLETTLEYAFDFLPS